MDVYSSTLADKSLDALTSVLHMLRLAGTGFRRLSLAAPWGIEFSAPAGASGHIIDQGNCWLDMPQLSEPLALRQGDLIVVANCPRYTLRHHPESQAYPLAQAVNQRGDDGIVRFEGAITDPVCTLLCGDFLGERNAIYPLFSVLPPLIHIQSVDGKAVEWVAAPMQMLSYEAQHAYPGTETVISRLMDILFIMVIRHWIAHQSPGNGGWFSALYHPQIGVVLGLIHQHPEEQWTVERLAAATAMSRSALANQFTALVGEPPMRYLTRWRMQVATLLLTMKDALTIEAIAHRVGYTSAYAFSKAFKRFVGVSPSKYRHDSQRNPRAQSVENLQTRS